MSVNSNNQQTAIALHLQREAELQCLRERVGALDLKLQKMAAENAGLNEKMNKLATWPDIEFYASAWEFNNCDGHAALELLCDTETPATDAFLAEVRAQESKRVYESILDNPAVTDMESLVDWLEQYANDSVAFAAELRNGVQS